MCGVSQSDTSGERGVLGTERERGGGGGGCAGTLASPALENKGVWVTKTCPPPPFVVLLFVFFSFLRRLQFHFPQPLDQPQGDELGWGCGK